MRHSFLENKISEHFPIQFITNTQSKTIEISPGKTLNIGTHLDSSQEEKLIQLLRNTRKHLLGTTPICTEFTLKHALTIFI